MNIIPDSDRERRKESLLQNCLVIDDHVLMIELNFFNHKIQDSLHSPWMKLQQSSELKQYPTRSVTGAAWTNSSWIHWFPANFDVIFFNQSLDLGREFATQNSDLGGECSVRDSVRLWKFRSGWNRGNRGNCYKIVRWVVCHSFLGECRYSWMKLLNSATVQNHEWDHGATLPWMNVLTYSSMKID